MLKPRGAKKIRPQISINCTNPEHRAKEIWLRGVRTKKSHAIIRWPFFSFFLSLRYEGLRIYPGHSAPIPDAGSDHSNILISKIFIHVLSRRRSGSIKTTVTTEVLVGLLGGLLHLGVQVCRTQGTDEMSVKVDVE